MNLYEIPEGSRIRVPLKSPENEYEGVITFQHLDGMYSYCVTDDGHVVHLNRMAELEEDGDGQYKLKGMK